MNNIRPRAFSLILLSLSLFTLAAGCVHRRPDEPMDFHFTYSVMGRGAASERELARFLLKGNWRIGRKTAFEMARFYIEEGAAEGVNHDLAFVQMCLETGYLRYGGDVNPRQYNFCGLGATGGGNPGLSFPDRQTGVRAHIQHLKAYGSEEPLVRESVDPRFKFVKRGRAPILFDLAGTWAADRAYGGKLALLMEKLYTFVRKNRRVKPGLTEGDKGYVPPDYALLRQRKESEEPDDGMDPEAGTEAEPGKEPDEPPVDADPEIKR